MNKSGKLSIAVLALLGVFVLLNNVPPSSINLASKKDDDGDAAFDQYVPKYKKNYKDKTEYSKKKQAFKDNYSKVKAHNATKQGFSIDINQFADLSPSEFSNIVKLNLKNAKDYNTFSRKFKPNKTKSDD